MEPVTGFDEVESLVRTGLDSAEVRVVPQVPDERWKRWLAAERGTPPPEPYGFGLRSLVIVPTYNERENLEALVPAALAWLDADVLVVDDNSPDGTGEQAERMAGKEPRIHVLRRPQKQGLGFAYMAGFAWALKRGCYDRVFEMDCDMSHSPWDLPRLAHASLAADLVIGSRYQPGGATPGWTRRRRLLSRAGNEYARLWLGRRVRDWTSGFRCFRTSLLRDIGVESLKASGFLFQVETTWRARQKGARIKEVPIWFVDRTLGKSKMSGSIVLEALGLPAMRFSR